MTDTCKKLYPIQLLYHDNYMRWISSVLAAVGLNIGLFILMPVLINSTIPQLDVETTIPQINIIRLPEQVKKKPIEAPAPVKTSANISEITEQTAPAPKPLPLRKLTLPFAINPRLPATPTSLELPTPETTLEFDADWDRIFPAAELDAPLTALVRIPPLYPLRARQRGIEGWVRVRFLVDEQGNVDQVTILEAQPPGIFEKNVQRCVSGWQFKPGTIEGVAVSTQVETTINFELE